MFVVIYEQSSSQSDKLAQYVESSDKDVQIVNLTLPLASTIHQSWMKKARLKIMNAIVDNI